MRDQSNLLHDLGALLILEVPLDRLIHIVVVLHRMLDRQRQVFEVEPTDAVAFVELEQGCDTLRKDRRALVRPLLLIVFVLELGEHRVKVLVARVHSSSPRLHACLARGVRLRVLEARRNMVELIENYLLVILRVVQQSSVLRLLFFFLLLALLACNLGQRRLTKVFVGANELLRHRDWLHCEEKVLERRALELLKHVVDTLGPVDRILVLLAFDATMLEVERALGRRRLQEELLDILEVLVYPQVAVEVLQICPVHLQELIGRGFLARLLVCSLACDFTRIIGNFFHQIFDLGLELSKVVHTTAL